MSVQRALFLRTKDKETRDKLIAEGFQLVDDKNGWLFINKATEGNFKFDKTKVSFSNILYA